MSVNTPAKKPSNSNKKARERRSSGRAAGKGRARISSKATPPRDREKEPSAVRKSPRQQRSKEMVDAILQASAEIFAQLGYARATTNKIAQRAGVSVGSLYQYFPNKDSLLVRLMEQHHRDVHEVVDRALDRLADPAIGLEDCLRTLLSELVAVHRANPELTRALAPAVVRDSPAMEAVHKAEPDAGRGMRVVAALAARSDVRPGDHLAMAAVLGQTMSQLTRWMVHDPPPGMTADDLAEEITQLLVRYLQIPGG